MRRLSLRVVAALSVFLVVGCDRGSEGKGGTDAPPARGLVEAAAAGDLRAVRRMLTSGAEANARGARGRTAVTAAAMGEHVDVVRALVEGGADVDLQDDERNNALLVCGENGNVEVLREVLRGRPNMRATNRYGGTVLIPASDRGHVAMVRALLRTDVPIDHVNRLGWTALLEAVILGDGGEAHQEIVRLLVLAGADTQIADSDGITALQHARSRGYAEIIRTLERAGDGAG